MEKNDLAVIEDSQMQTAAAVKAQVQRIQEVMKAVMKDGTHYGTVPGCGDRPTLLKPGAEKIMATFRLAADPQVEDLSGPDKIRYRVKVLMLAPDGHFVGAGIGECSSEEEKYKWKKATCDEEFEATPEDRRRLKWKAGWKDKPAISVKQIRTNPADVANTILKMAKKRALVDGVLTATAASDIFTQDLDPDDDGGNGGGATPKKKSDTVKPKGANQAKPKDEKTPREKLREAIGKICGGEEQFFDETLFNCSKFTKDGEERALTSMDQIDNPSTNETWIKASLGAARKFIAEMEEGK